MSYDVIYWMELGNIVPMEYNRAKRYFEQSGESGFRNGRKQYNQVYEFDVLHWRQRLSDLRIYDQNF